MSKRFEIDYNEGAYKLRLLQWTSLTGHVPYDRADRSNRSMAIYDDKVGVLGIVSHTETNCWIDTAK